MQQEKVDGLRKKGKKCYTKAQCSTDGGSPTFDLVELENMAFGQLLYIEPPESPINEVVQEKSKLAEGFQLKVSRYPRAALPHELKR